MDDVSPWTPGPAAPHGRRASRRRWLCGALLTGALGAWAFQRAGAFLVVEDAFRHAELAVVLSGDVIRRPLAARDLYRQGRIDRILVVPEPPDPTDQELIRLGLRDPGAPPISQRILLASGVPREKIAYLPEPAEGTIVEARRVKAFLTADPPSSLVIVTSKFPARRARLIFRRVLRGTVGEVFCYPSPYDPFQPARWWSKPRDALYVVLEYQKLLANLLTLALGRQG